jgi:hypothetical protein
VRVPRVLLAAVVGLVLGGCSSSDVTLESRPTDADSARDIAELVARTADCGSVEYYDDTTDHWTFTCQSGRSGEHSYEIAVVRDDRAKFTVLDEWGGTPPVRVGAYFLVQAARNVDGSASGDVDRFPGEIPRGAG